MLYNPFTLMVIINSNNIFIISVGEIFDSLIRQYTHQSSRSYWNKNESKGSEGGQLYSQCIHINKFCDNIVYISMNFYREFIELIFLLFRNTIRNFKTKAAMLLIYLKELFVTFPSRQLNCK